MKLDNIPETIEIIEIIDDDSDAFADRPQDRTAHDTGGPRWVGPVAAATLVGLIGYGVVTSTSGSPAPGPATNTSLVIVIPTFQPATTTLPSPPPIPYYAADPSPEFSVRFADSLTFGNDFGLSKYQLWSTPGASATTGSWFSVTSFRGASTVYAGNSYRLQAGVLSIAMSHSAGGHAVAQFTAPHNLGVTIAAFGWSDEDLVRLAGSVNADGISFSDAWFASDHHLVSNVPPWLAMRGVPIEQIGYSTSHDSSPVFVVTIGEAPANEPLSEDEHQLALRFLLDRNTPFTVDGHPAVAGTVIGEGNLSVANWIAGDYIITVAGQLPLSQIIGIARTVHEITAPEWTDIKLQAEGTTPLDIPQINAVVDDQRTFVLADLPKGMVQSAELHILRDGLDPVIVPLADIDPNADRTFAAYAFSEAVPYTAQIVAGDGAVVATWPAS